MNIKLVEVLNNYELLLLFKEKSYCQRGEKNMGNDLLQTNGLFELRREREREKQNRFDTKLTYFLTNLKLTYSSKTLTHVHFLKIVVIQFVANFFQKNIVNFIFLKFLGRIALG